MEAGLKNNVDNFEGNFSEKWQNAVRNADISVFQTAFL